MIKMKITNRGKILRRLRKIKKIEYLKLIREYIKDEEELRLIYENRKER